MASAPPLPPYKKFRERSAWLCDGLVVMMFACFGVGFAWFGLRFDPSWNGFYMTWLCALASIEALYSSRRARDLEGRDLFLFRFAEAVTLAAVLKVFFIIRDGPNEFIRLLPNLHKDFFNLFFQWEYLIALGIMAVCWILSASLARELDDLHEREADASWDELGKLQNALREIRDTIIAQVGFLGFLVILMAIFARLNFREFVRVAAGTANPNIPVVNVLVFAILTLGLYSQTQFVLLRTRWAWQKSPVSPGLAGAWLRYSILFFGALATLSFFMPTQYSLGFLQTLGFVIGLIFNFIQIIIFLLLTPLTLCARLFSTGDLGSQIAPIPPLVPPPSQSQPPVPILEFLKLFLFWAVLVGILAVSFWQFVITNRPLWKRLVRIPALNWLSIFFQSIWSWISGAGKQTSRLFSKLTARIRNRTKRANSIKIGSAVLPGGRLPREKVIQLYLAVVDLAKNSGLERRPGQTPYQYETDLETFLPEDSQDIHDLTQAFIEARYSRRVIKENDLPPLQKAWQSLSRSFRSRTERLS